MLFKILVLILVLIAVYYIFFNKIDKKNRKKPHKDEMREINSETMIACSKCGVYVSVGESIIKDGKYYCSIECSKSN